jgi:flagellar motility protein MotE (MotC chaperone)
MNRVRLLPIVIVAASGLLVLKSAHLVTSGEALFTSAPQARVTREEDLPWFARALARHRFVPPGDDQVVTGSTPGKKDDPKKPDAKADPKKPEAKKEEPKPAQVAQAQPQPQPQPLPPPSSPSERAILERLQERRGSLDERTREIEMRENLLRAAEKKVDGRIGELKEVEDRISAGARAEKEEADRQMKTIVIMYETMKPKDAAKVFDRLNISVLMPIATAMNPRKMAEVLAVMSPEAAERLTVALAAKTRDASAGPAPVTAAPQGELPRIDQPPARPATPQRR